MNADTYNPAQHEYHIGKAITLLTCAPAGNTEISSFPFLVDGEARHINFIRKVAKGSEDSYSYCIITQSDDDAATVKGLFEASLRRYKLQLLLTD